MDLHLVTSPSQDFGLELYTSLTAMDSDSPHWT